MRHTSIFGLLWAAFAIAANMLPVSAAASAFDQGVEAYKASNYGTAKKFFDQALSENPQNSSAMYYKALCLQQIGSLAEASKVYHSIIQQFPSSQAASYAKSVLNASKAAAAAPAKSPASASVGVVTPSPASSTPNYLDLKNQNASEEELARLPDEERIPFTRGAGGHLFVTAFIDRQPVQLMFDTGAASCLIPKSYAPNARMTGQKERIGGVGTNATEAGIGIVNLRLGKIEREMPVTIVDGHNMPLLGETFFNAYHYDIDNSAGVIHLVKKTVKKAGYTPYDTIDVPFQEVGNNMVVTGKINGNDCRMYLDTGAGVNTFSYAHALMVGLRIPSNARTMAISGVAGTVPGFMFNVDTIELGAVAKHNVPIVVVLTGGPPLPLLGQPFLSDRHFTIDNERHLIHFQR